MGREIKIRVINLSGKSIHIDVNSNMLVSELKKEILGSSQFGSCRFLHKSKELNSDDKTLESYGLTDNSDVYMLATLKGGAPYTFK